MSYKSKAELERERWMTLPEAVEHIRAADRCDVDGACQQIVKALADGVRVLGPLRWERERGDKPPPFGYSAAIVPTDEPPLGRDWGSAEICWDTGRVRDDRSEHKNGNWRVLLILRAKIEQHWPLAAALNSVGETPVARRKPRKQTKRALAHIELQAEYPSGIPNDEPQPVAVTKIGDRLTRRYGKEFSISNDTIARAVREARSSAALDAR